MECIIFSFACSDFEKSGKIDVQKCKVSCLSLLVSRPWRGPLRHVYGHTNHGTTMVHIFLESLSNLNVHLASRCRKAAIQDRYLIELVAFSASILTKYRSILSKIFWLCVFAVILVTDTPILILFIYLLKIFFVGNNQNIFQLQIDYISLLVALQRKLE